MTLESRLREPEPLVQVVSGPRQTGKTTAVRQALDALDAPHRFSDADRAAVAGRRWLEAEWEQARSLAEAKGGAVLFVDEVQKVDDWPAAVKGLWDEDRWNGVPLKVVLSGSSSLLMAKGLSESLNGRYERLRSTHWSLPEMEAAFGYSLDDYLWFGGFPGAARFRSDPGRWRSYMRDSIIDATVSRDVIQLQDVRKPALMRQLFGLGAQWSAQEISYRKLLGQLDDRGNTDTVKHYLDLLAGAGLMSGLQKHTGKQVQERASSPRLLVHDPSLMTASWDGSGDLLHDPALRGHLVETAVGDRLLALYDEDGSQVMWWRDRDREVDFVVRHGGRTYAVEVKSGRVKGTGLPDFLERFPGSVPVLVGDRNLTVEDFLKGNGPI